MVRVIDRPFLAPGEVEARRDDHLGPEPAERGRQVAPQRDAVFHEPVLMVEELHLADAYDGRAAALLLDPQRSRLVRRHACDTGLAPGREQVGDLLALPGPAGHGGCHAVFKIIRMGHHRDGPVPVLRYRLHLPDS
jgi:hypothetical protein